MNLVRDIGSRWSAKRKTPNLVRGVEDQNDALLEGKKTNSIRVIVQFSSVQFSSVQGGIYALGKLHMIRSTPSLGSFPNVALETVPMWVRLTMALFRPLEEDR